MNKTKSHSVTTKADRLSDMLTLHDRVDLRDTSNPDLTTYSFEEEVGPAISLKASESVPKLNLAALADDEDDIEILPFIELTKGTCDNDYNYALRRSASCAYLERLDQLSPRPSSSRMCLVKDDSKPIRTPRSRDITKVPATSSNRKKHIQRAQSAKYLRRDFYEVSIKASAQLNLSQELSSSSSSSSTSYTHPEPFYELNNEYSFGKLVNKINPAKANEVAFTPNSDELKEHGGKSIDLYENWRRLQYKESIVMHKFLAEYGVNMSVLPPSNNYDMWRDTEWRNAWTKATGLDLDKDPNQDCDVRFYEDKKTKKARRDIDRNKKQLTHYFDYKIAPASILQDQPWKKRKFLKTVLLIGLPSHVTIAWLTEYVDHVTFEFFDPAGSGCDKIGQKALKHFIHDHLSTLYGNKPIIFSQNCSTVDIQSDKGDVMCQTWVWYWAYFRIIRGVSSRTMAMHMNKLVLALRTLESVNAFKNWLFGLYQRDYVKKESRYEVLAVEKHTPKRIEEMKKKIKKDKLEYNFNMDDNFKLSKKTSFRRLKEELMKLNL